MVAERKPKKEQAPKREPVITVAKMTSKGQITVPKFVRDHFNFKPGDEVVFVEDAQGVHVRRKLNPERFKKWHGYLKDLKGSDVDRLIDEMRGR